MSSRIPPLLEPYLVLPPDGSLTVLTSVLGASSNWLVLRYLYSFLRGVAAGDGDVSGEGGTTGVVLVSFLRDMAFWREGASKLGLDLDALSRTGRFSFVDGLTGLFVGADIQPPGVKGKRRVLRGGKLLDVKGEIEAALGQDLTGAGRKVLVVDQIDALVAMMGGEGGVTGLGVQEALLSLREQTHSTVLTFAADAPLIQAQTTTLEREHAALVLSQAHAARTVLALRMLDTGVARDVSGVVGVTSRDAEDGGEESAEFLYFVGGDGGVRVFERGT